MSNVTSTDASRGVTYAHDDRDTHPRAPTVPTIQRDMAADAIVTSPSHDPLLAAFAASRLGGAHSSASTSAPGGAQSSAPTSAAHATSAVTVTPAKTPTQLRLDAYRDAYAGPYSVGGGSVSAPPQFRMAGGFNDAAAGYLGSGRIDAKAPKVKELLAACARSHLPFPSHCLTGGATARELTSVTQALIDAGKLPAGPGNVATRIKAMQWEYGIGVDCTDYVVGAAMHAGQRSWSSVAIPYRQSKLPMPGCDYYYSPETNPHLAPVRVTSAQPGDVLRLDDPTDVGHRAIVYSHSTVNVNASAALAERLGPSAAPFFAGGRVHVYELDSSWGAGTDGASYGGVRRDTVFFNETTGQWAQLNPRVNAGHAPRFEVTPNGPSNEHLHGLYRWR